MLHWALPIEHLDLDEFTAFPDNYTFEEARPATNVRYDLHQAFTLPVTHAGKSATLAWCVCALCVLFGLQATCADVLDAGVRVVVLEWYLVLRALYVAKGGRTEPVWFAHALSVPLAASALLAPSLSSEPLSASSWVLRVACVLVAIIDVCAFRTVVLWTHVVYGLAFVVCESAISTSEFGANPAWGAAAVAAYLWCFGIIFEFNLHKEECSHNPRFSVSSLLVLAPAAPAAGAGAGAAAAEEPEHESLDPEECP